MIGGSIPRQPASKSGNKIFFKFLMGSSWENLVTDALPSLYPYPFSLYIHAIIGLATCNTVWQQFHLNFSVDAAVVDFFVRLADCLMRRVVAFCSAGSVRKRRNWVGHRGSMGAWGIGHGTWDIGHRTPDRGDSIYWPVEVEQGTYLANAVTNLAALNGLIY